MAEHDGRELVAVAQAALLDDPAFLRGLVPGAVQAILEAEMTAPVGAERYERGEGRSGHRNGSKPRRRHTRVGTLELRVPQDREGTSSTELFARDQRSERALVLTWLELDLHGVSTRKVAAITEQWCGTSFAKSQVSALTATLDAPLAAWRHRPLTAASSPYLTVDARDEHVRIDGRVVRQGVLIVAGVRDDGRREILAVAVADTEREATSHELFRALPARGVRGVGLVTSDDHAGLRAALARHVQGACRQRCQVPFARTRQGRVGVKHRARLAEDLRAIFAAPEAAQARTTARTCAERWQRRHPAVATHLEEELEPGLACSAVPPAHRPRVRTTNGLERFHQELKRRTRVVRIFPNRAALLRLVSALAMEQSEEWVSGRRYLDLEPLREVSPPAMSVAPAA